ncbi:MAG: glycoside hydrolase family 3 N-terminal domain-containing protein [Sphingomonas sp.]
MGFQGFVVGDWNGHGQIPGCTATDCAATFNAGLDMAMAPDSWKGLYEVHAQARQGRHHPDGADRRCGAPHPARQGQARAVRCRAAAGGQAGADGRPRASRDRARCGWPSRWCCSRTRACCR